MTLIERFCDKQQQQTWPEHPLFGKLSGKDWAALSYKHLNHHLRQFGCKLPLRPLAPAAMHPDPLLGDAADLLFDVGGHQCGERDWIVVATRFHRLVESQV